MEELNSIRTDLNLEFSQHQWLTDKMKECGEAVGISVDTSKAGQGKLIAFAHGREKENRTTLTLERSNKKGSRELHNLSCSINYDKRSEIKEKKSYAQKEASKGSKAIRSPKGCDKGCQ